MVASAAEMWAFRYRWLAVGGHGSSEARQQGV